MREAESMPASLSWLSCLPFNFSVITRRQPLSCGHLDDLVRIASLVDRRLFQIAYQIGVHIYQQRLPPIGSSLLRCHQRHLSISPCDCSRVSLASQHIPCFLTPRDRFLRGWSLASAASRLLPQSLKPPHVATCLCNCRFSGSSFSLRSLPEPLRLLPPRWLGTR